MAAAFAMADMRTYSLDEYRDISKAESKRSQNYINKTIEAFSNFLDPFDSSADRSRLYNISSGVAVSADIKKIYLQLKNKEPEQCQIL